MSHVKTTITRQGRVTIPAEIRREMHLTAGQVVIWAKVSATECRLIVPQRRKSAPDPIGALNFAKEHGLETMGTVEWMKILRDGEEE
jgi:AbrB family looped-hinge helix DNA binding protein